MSNDTAIASDECCETLPEQSRREYLQAMGIISWLPKDQVWQASLSKLQSRPLSEPSLKNVSKSSQESIRASVPTILTSSKIDSTAVQKPSELSEKIEEVGEIDEVCEIADIDAYPAKSQFLRLLNWSHQSTLSSQSKRLLVICRHKVNEPANSFASATAPSQFMLDYIKSLVEITRSNGIEIEVQLAHLSQVGLADDSLAFADGLNKSKPDLVLILGDETINQFVADKASVAELRGKQITLSEQLKACVSYHPFTLIQDPLLKRLAFEDLRQLSSFFDA